MTIVIMKPNISTPEEVKIAESKMAYVGKLLQMLADHPLRREDFDPGYFANPEPHMVTHGETRKERSDGTFGTVYLCSKLKKGVWSFGGNFYDWSWAFICYTDESEIIAALRLAIRKNMESFEFVVQQPYTGGKAYSEIVGETIEDWIAFFDGSGYKALE